MKIIKAPNKFMPIESISVFLAGSIEMGKAENWQKIVENELKNLDLIILNPRRDDWDSSWIQSIDNSKFREQVEWELLAQEKTNIIAMYFCPETKSPITLLELGLFAHTNKMIACCPEGYWRKGNIDIVCNRYGIEQAKSLNELIDKIIRRIKKGAKNG